MVDANWTCEYIHDRSWSYLHCTEWQRSWNFHFAANMFDFGKDFH